MPLPTKTVREASVELGMPENELRALIQMNKIRAVFKKGTFHIAPDEMGKIKRLRKTLTESEIKSSAPAPVAKPAPMVKPAAVKTAPPRPGQAPGPTRPGPQRPSV